MKLGDLEFTAADGDNYIPPGFADVVITIERANRILAEKLAKAPVVYCDNRLYGNAEGHGGHTVWCPLERCWEGNNPNSPGPRSAARLVCIAPTGVPKPPGGDSDPR